MLQFPVNWRNGSQKISTPKGILIFLSISFRWFYRIASLYQLQDVVFWGISEYCSRGTFLACLQGRKLTSGKNGGEKNTRTSGMMDLPFFKKRSSHHENSHGDLVDQFTPKWIKATRSKKYIRYSSYVIYAILLVPFTLSYLCNCDFGRTIVSSDFLPFGSPTLSP